MEKKNEKKTYGFSFINGLFFWYFFFSLLIKLPVKWFLVHIFSIFKLWISYNVFRLKKKRDRFTVTVSTHKDPKSLVIICISGVQLQIFTISPIHKRISCFIVTIGKYITDFFYFLFILPF